MHMQLDPGQFGTTGAYTLEWKNLNLITAGAGDFNADGTVDGTDFLLWQRDQRVGSLADWKANFDSPLGGRGARHSRAGVGRTFGNRGDGSTAPSPCCLTRRGASPRPAERGARTRRSRRRR